MNIQMELLDNYARIRAAFVNKFLPASYMDAANESACSRFMWDYMPKSDYPSVSFAVALNLLRSCSGDVIFMSEESTYLIGRNNTRWCISYIATITYGAIIVPILQDFNPSDVENIVPHSESKYLFAGEIYWQTLDSDRMPELDAAVTIDKFKVVYEKEGSHIVADIVAGLDAAFAEKYPLFTLPLVCFRGGEAGISPARLYA